MAEEHPRSDIQLEDVEDYTSDYPPEYPGGEDDITGGQGEKRVGVIRGLVCGNKKMTALLGLVFVLVVAIIGILAVGGDEDGNTGFHQPLIIIDPSTLDSKVTVPLMETLLAMYDRNALDPAPLNPSAGDETPQRRAFFWLAHDNQNVDHTTKMSRYALAVLYYSSNKVPTEYDEDPLTWFIARRWLTKANFCEWHGIVCDDEEHVIGIEMERNFMSGKLPVELDVMKETLEWIDISSNGVAMQDEDFDLFKKMTNLEEFTADDNYLEYHSGLPPQMRHLTSLQKLTLSYNLFEGQLEGPGAVHVLTNMTKLTHLEVESNYFTGSMPAHIGNMDKLIYLYMRRNNMDGDLSFLTTGQMTNLFAMWLDGNDITGTIPTEVGQLQNLASLSMSNTKLSGPIPNQLGDAFKLRRVWLYNNELSGNIPNELEKLNKLEVFEVHNNNLSGDMPSGICDIFSSVDYEFKALTSDCNGAVTCLRSCCTKCY